MDQAMNRGSRFLFQRFQSLVGIEIQLLFDPNPGWSGDRPVHTRWFILTFLALMRIGFQPFRQI